MYPLPAVPAARLQLTDELPVAVQTMRSHVPRVRVPQIKWEATSRRVITMEWIDGVKLTDEKGRGHCVCVYVCVCWRR